MGKKKKKKPLQVYSVHQTLRHFNTTWLLFLNTTKSPWIQILWRQSYWLFVILTGFINMQKLDSQGTFIPKQRTYPPSNIKHRSLHEEEDFHWTASLPIRAHVKDGNPIPCKDTTLERLTNCVCITLIGLDANTVWMSMKYPTQD